ncbi:PDZ domain-containing protein [Saccharibacillus sp. CPCC 101409]|uniref:PDZ domain-containing protein n=1 Tax=Saccharibacillus sp. CPCC 101409 TaxID=3058041 RepID=UPI002672FB05|nr:PDZ domain-containing protein [Saccharibacillus sp. CPCC 101409]MDO3412037.1 PDZ domain-containing protein [Saccharibacillus sp. CPCC 101409]
MNEYLEIILSGLLELVIQPFYWAGLLILLLYYRRQGILERRLFHIRLHGYGALAGRALLGGLCAGAVVSLAMAGLGFTLTPQGAAAVWIAALVLFAARIRFANFVYAVGVLGALQFALRLIPGLPDRGVWAAVLGAVDGLNVPALLVLAALLHLAEGVLVAAQGKHFALPTYIPGKRGRPVGAYVLRLLWLAPTLLLVPAEGGAIALPWQPPLLAWLGLPQAAGYTLLALPALIGLQETTWTLLPEQKVRHTSRRALLFGAALLALAAAAVFWPPATVIAAVAAIVLRELLIRGGQREEEGHAGMYTHSGKGLKVLAVQPGSPAESLGVLAGETLLKVNGSPVSTPQQMHEALRVNSAFCKLEVQNRSGESKFMQSPIYEGDHHQLGFIFAPDDDSAAEVPDRPASPIGLWRAEVEAERGRGAGAEAAAEREREAEAGESREVSADDAGVRNRA